MSKLSINKIKKMKNDGQRISALTAYDYSTAKCIDEAGVDIILVGDSLAMVALGYENTLSVEMDEMLVFTKAVARGVKNALVIGDMPFLSYQASICEAVKNAGKMIKAGASAVKIEGGGKYICELVERLTQSGIPVLAHLGFTPQFLNTIGGYNIQGKSFENTLKILKQANELEEAGAFGIVLEMVPEESAKYITDNLNIPTIGIGAGRHTSGQILVSDDILGKFGDFTPKFARKYSDMTSLIKNSAKNYINDVKNLNFPNESELFKLSEEELNLLSNHSKSGITK